MKTTIQLTINPHLIAAGQVAAESEKKSFSRWVERLIQKELQTKK